ncbi:MAG: hypothetical protein CMN30_09245 [Sandaracinus sp.]|nr:hypothetical protein [Sandaracinus sp.]
MSGDGIYETVFTHIGDGVVLTGRDGMLADWSPGAERLFGYTKAEAVGRSPDFVFQFHQPGLNAQVLRALQEKDSWQGELRFRRKDGTEGWCETLVVLVRDDDGSRRLTIGVHRDISARREAEATAQVSAAILENSREAVHLIRREDASFIFVNPAFERVFGYTAAEVIGQHVQMINAPGDPDPAAVAMEILGQLEEKGHWSGELWNVAKDGRVFPCRARVTSFDDPRHGEVWLTFQEDITEERRAAEQREEMEERARRTQRMHALGVLAGGIAHDFNNVLQGIHLARTDLADVLAGQPDTEEPLTTIEQLVHRGRGLVRRILTFARPNSEVLSTTVDLAELVRRTMAMVRPLLDSQVDVVVAPLPPRAEILGQVDQLQQLVVNLATNGALAMKGRGGRLEVIVDGVRRDESSWWRLRVRDHGVGIPEEAQAHIFDPFFTTRSVGEGTGLGLAIVSSVAEAHGARLAFDSKAGEGTTFEILFPAQGPIALGDRPRIAIVDDEADILRNYQRLLDRRGYQAALYPSVDTFLANLDQEAIDAVLTDLSMPGRSGLALASEIRARRPGLPIILMTGHASPATETLRAAGVRACLAKPFDFSDLIATLDQVLADPRA